MAQPTCANSSRPCGVSQRRATRGEFVCVLVLAGPGGAEQVFEARITGTLLDEPRGGAGFGYDPLFVPDGFRQTYAELSDAEKNRISHRSQAWAKLGDVAGAKISPGKVDPARGADGVLQTSGEALAIRQV